MTALLDTSFLLALYNRKDVNHSRVRQVAESLSEPLVLPVTVLPEVSYLLGSRLGHAAMRRFLQKIVSGNVTLESVDKSDLARVAEILERYSDSRLDFVDATIVALAERLIIARILTLDRRDFTIIRPKHCEYFEILP